LTGTHTARCADIQRAFAAGGVPTEISDSIIAEMWVKLFGFATVAAIATLTRARAGEIARCAGLARLVNSVIEECARVTTAEGYPPPAVMKDNIRELFAQLGSIISHRYCVTLNRGVRPRERTPSASSSAAPIGAE